MTYRTYLVILLSVVALAQTTAALQWTLFEQDVALVAAAAAASRPASVQPTVALAAAGGVSVLPLRQAQGEPPAPTLPTKASAVLAAPLPEAALKVRHEAPCDTVTTTADICVAPPDAVLE